MGVVNPTPNPQPGGPGYPFLSGSSPLTYLAWEAPPVAYATASIALRIMWPHKPHHYVKVVTPSGGGLQTIYCLISRDICLSYWLVLRFSPTCFYRKGQRHGYQSGTTNLNSPKFYGIINTKLTIMYIIIILSDQYRLRHFLLLSERACRQTTQLLCFTLHRKWDKILVKRNVPVVHGIFDHCCVWKW